MPLRSATPSDLDVLWRLLDDIDAADGYYPLTEAAVLAVRQGEGRGVVVTDGGVIVDVIPTSSALVESSGSAMICCNDQRFASHLMRALLSRVSVVDSLSTHRSPSEPNA